MSVSMSVSQAQALPALSHFRISLSEQDVRRPTVNGSPDVPAPDLSRPPSEVTLRSSLPITPSTSLNVDAIVIESAALSPVIDMSVPARN